MNRTPKFASSAASLLPMLAWCACAREPGKITLSADSAPLNVLEAEISVDLEESAAIFAICTSALHPEERHLVESQQPALHHDLVVRGLLPDTVYACTVSLSGSGAAWQSVGFRTGSVALPPFVAQGEPTGAYTLLNTQQGAYAVTPASLVIVDPEGQVRLWYEVGADLVLDLDAEVERDAAGEPFIHVGGGWAHQRPDQPNKGVFRDIDLSGNTLLERSAPAFGVGFNHHSERLDDGSYLSLSFHEEASSGSAWYGAGIEQWHPEQGLVWSWSTQPLVDDGTLPLPPADLTALSPYHPNSVSFVDDALGPAAWLSLYVSKEIWRIDRATGARTHVFGATGEFSLFDAAGTPLPADQWPYVQHDPDWIVEPEGTLRVLMYDNGAGRPVDVPYSRVVEYRIDLETREAWLLWDWTEPGWYDPVTGDADYLPSGNVLVTQGFNLARTPDSDDVSELIELRPPDEVVWRLTFTDQDYPVFRAQRYDGCELFANARYCPAVAERIEMLQQGLAP